MRVLRFLKRELGAEAQGWVNDGLVTREQAERILERYGASLPTGRERSLGYYVLVALAALFGGLSLLVFVSANWEQIPRAARMGGLVALTLAFHGVGLALFRKKGETPASIAFFLGCLSYGTSIFLIAQIYHLGEHFPDGIFWWALGTLPFALLTRTLPCAYLATALSLAWLVAETRESFVPTAWPLLGLPLLWFCLREKHSKVVFLGVLASGTLWLEVLVSHWLSGTRSFDGTSDLVPLTLGLFVVYHAWGKLWEDHASNPEWGEYGALLRLWSVRLGLVALLVLSFEDPWREMIGIEYQSPLLVAGILAATLLASGVLSALYLRRGAPLRQVAVWANAAAFTLLVVVSLVTTDAQDESAVYFQVFTNLLCIGTGIWLIVRALEEALTHYFYAGIGLILITALLRYVDLVGDYVGASLLFMVFAALLLGAARFWKSRTAEAAR